MFAFGGILLLVLNATVPQVHERVERTSQALTADEAGLDAALSGRGRIWGAAPCMAREHPINGVGARNLRDEIGRTEGRGTVCRSVCVSVGAGTIKKKKNQ